MQFAPSLRLLSCLGEIKRIGTEITLPLEALYGLLRAIYVGEAFDPVWYRTTYLDVAIAIADGKVPDEITHFIHFGYLENRRPRAFDVDAAWYEKTYHDVAAAIRSGAVADARTHFNNAGYFEARAPDAATARAFAHLLEAAAAKARKVALPAPSTDAGSSSTAMRRTAQPASRQKTRA
jgi:hypothetical protein